MDYFKYFRNRHVDHYISSSIMIHPEMPGNIKKNSFSAFLAVLLYGMHSTCFYLTVSEPKVVLITVISTPWNRQQRNQVRSTWCNECRLILGCRCVFLIGRARNEIEKEEIEREARLRMDILQVDVVESYYNLTLKTIHSLR